MFLSKLKFTGHVLLYSWSNKTNLSSHQSGDRWKQGCPIGTIIAHRAMGVAEASDQLALCIFQSSEFGDIADRSVYFDNDPDDILIPSDARRAFRRHVSTLVHRLSQQLLFKSRKQHTSVLAHRKDSYPVFDPKRLTTSGPSKKHPAASCRAHRSFKTSVEYLLFCPDISSSNWDGPVYAPPSDSSDNVKPPHYRRLSCALRWIVSICSMSTSSLSSRPSPKAATNSSPAHSTHTIIPIVCWLLSDRPYSAWTVLCESSARFRSWLSLGLSSSLIHNGCGCFSDNTLLDRKTSRRFTVNIQLVPIQPDVCTLVAALRKSLCDLAAQLQGSLLIMESHRRSAQVLTAVEPDYLVVFPDTQIDCILHTPSSRSSTFREFVQQTMTVDNVQKAYSVVFGFHKTLVRFLNAAPVRSLDNLTTESNIVKSSGPIQVRLVNLGVQLLTSWGHFVTKCYPRGRGRMPRWANDACQFAYQLCQPWCVKYLRANKLSSLEMTLNTLIPHLVGEDQPTSSVQSSAHSATSLSPGDAGEHHVVDRHHGRLTRCHSAITAYTNRLSQSVGYHRLVHSVHGTSGTQLKRQLVHTKHTKPSKSGKAVRANIISLMDLTEDQQTDSSRRVPEMLRLLAQLDANHDARLRYNNLIGRPLADFDRSCSPNPNSVVSPGEKPPDEVTLPQSNFLARASVNITGRRHFPYTWNRGRLIGKGVTGKVFQAFNLQTREMMAVKEVAFDYDVDTHTTSATNEETQMAQAQKRLDAFRQECALLSSLSHPSLVRFLGADEQTPKVLRLFTELCSAGTLSDIVRYRPAEALIRRCAWDLACAVAYLHDRGIVHRDIKPANIFLVGPPTVDMVNSLRSHKSVANVAEALRLNPGQSLLKLGDFSHSLRLHSLTSTIRGTVGTVQYMAPEVCRGLGSDYGRPCDIWSFCCVILELITGKSPWHDIPNDLAVLYKLGSDQLPKLPSIRSKRIGCALSTSMNHPPRSISNGAVKPGDSEIDDTQFYASAEAVHLLRAGINADPNKRPSASELFNFDFVQCNLGR
ncbi:mitogen-activated protein kinase kinase kinase 4 [Paragonimus westermani]|uniref:Mitogen-activated protein kinase kinase kinase 4 n=1 Tax=Paragonimus westermani TaxID=34504 RepID=A0A5J4NAA4_9TREM|nr:mitogen-activated protein kinase kinase kinase 4 [Paragonimus westermani]